MPVLFGIIDAKVYTSSEKVTLSSLFLYMAYLPFYAALLAWKIVALNIVKSTISLFN